MGITPDGWLDWAQRDPGPPDKRYPQANAAIGYVPHSAVGYYPGWRSRLFSTERDPQNPGRYSRYAAASVHGWIETDGSVIQHYSFTASCWASGNAHANTSFAAFENAGGPPGNESQPLTDAQVAANVRIIRELAARGGWAPRRPRSAGDRSATLYEHHECVTLWGGDPTACPSGRIPWARILAELGGDSEASHLLRLAGGEGMAMIISVRNSRKNWVSNGIARRFIATKTEREELVAAGLVPAAVRYVSQATLDAIPEVPAPSA